MRYEPNSISPNVIGGSPVNSVTQGVRGATIAGGGVPVGNTDPDYVSEAPNRVTDAYGTVSGGYGNVAGDDAGSVLNSPFATVGGGFNNTASGSVSTVGGGITNMASGPSSTVGGGNTNTASGFASTVGGGSTNTASGMASTAGGGNNNVANDAYSAVGGGLNNTASGFASTVAGGNLNVAEGAYSVALGRRAQSLADGQFHFADGNDFDFASFTPNAFRVRATGGVRFAVGIDGAGGHHLVVPARHRRRLGLLLRSQPETGYATARRWRGAGQARRHAGLCVEPEGEQLADPSLRADGAGLSRGLRPGRRRQDDRVAGRRRRRAGGDPGVERKGRFAAHRRSMPCARKWHSSGPSLRQERSARQVQANEIAAQAREISELRAQSTAEIASLMQAIEVLLARTAPADRVAIAR